MHNAKARIAFYRVFPRLACRLLLFMMDKGGYLMMAMFFAQRVILGKTTFAEVPPKLKDKVRELLEESGLPELAVEG